MSKLGNKATLKMDSNLIGDIIGVIAGPSASREMVDVTPLGATSKSFEAGLIDGGEVSISVMYDHGGTNHDALKTAFNSATAASSFEIDIDGDGTAEQTFTGWVSGLGLEVPQDEKVKLDVTIKVETSGF